MFYDAPEVKAQVPRTFDMDGLMDTTEAFVTIFMTRRSIGTKQGRGREMGSNCVVTPIRMLQGELISLHIAVVNTLRNVTKNSPCRHPERRARLCRACTRDESWLSG